MSANFTVAGNYSVYGLFTILSQPVAAKLAQSCHSELTRAKLFCFRNRPARRSFRYCFIAVTWNCTPQCAGMR